MTPVAPPKRRQSIVWRIASASLAVAILALALLYAVSFSAVERSAREALAATVTTDLAGLIDIHASGGQAELARRKLVIAHPTVRQTRRHFVLQYEARLADEPALAAFADWITKRLSTALS